MLKYNKSYVQVRYAVETGRLEADKVGGGWTWMFPVDKLPEQWPEAPRIEKRKRRRSASK